MDFSAFDFSSRHVFVAGGSSGINFGIAQAFARAGARLTIISRSADKVATAAQQLEGLGTQALGISADVRQPQALERAFATAAERFGHTIGWLLQHENRVGGGGEFIKAGVSFDLPVDDDDYTVAQCFDFGEDVRRE